MSREESYGMFIENGTAYKINTPYTPRPLTNVIVNDDGYLCELTHWGTGMATFQFPDGVINNITAQDKRTIYCRDEESGKVWNPGVYPMMSEVQEFSCEHHERYTLVSSVHDGIKVSWRIFIPLKGASEIWTVNVENRSNKPRRISVIPAVGLLLDGFPTPRFFGGQSLFSTCEFSEELNGMYIHAGNPNCKNKRFNALLASSEPVKYYSGDSEKFFGAPLAFHYPQVLLQNDNIGNYKGVGNELFQSVQNTFTIEPGACSTVDFLLGIVESYDEAEEAVKLIQNREAVEKLFNKNCEEIKTRRERLIIDTPNEKLNYFVNTWLKKGLEYGMVKKDATRDNLQFAYGYTMADTERVREELIRSLAWQYADGHALRSWVPLDTEYYCDGPLWVILTTCGYLKYSDDMEFLNVEIPYFDGGSGTVREHLERGIERIDKDRGPHNLPLARFADWNDALNLPDPQAESVFMAMGFGFMLKEMEALMRYLGENDKAEEYQAKHTELKDIINKVAWDEKGEYYIRAYSYGEVIGGSSSEGSTIFVNPQTWSIIGEIVTSERLPKVLKAIDEIIENDLGCPVNLPAYQHFDKKVGRISAQLPGTLENGASYCHVTAFKTTADTIIGRGDHALNSLLKVFPDHEKNPIIHSGAVPFSLTSSYNTNPDTWGRAGRPWLTGTQVWAMRTIVEGLLGVQRTYGGLRICPAFPSSWQKADCTLRRKNAEYRVHIRRVTEKPEKPTVKLNGMTLEGNVVPFGDTGVFEIVVEV